MNTKLVKSSASTATTQSKDDNVVKSVIDILLVIIKVAKIFLNALNAADDDDDEEDTFTYTKNSQTFTIKATMRTSTTKVYETSSQTEKCGSNEKLQYKQKSTETIEQEWESSVKITRQQSVSPSSNNSTEQRQLKSALKVTPPNRSTANISKNGSKSVSFSVEKNSVKFYEIMDGAQLRPLYRSTGSLFRPTSRIFDEEHRRTLSHGCGSVSVGSQQQTIRRRLDF